MHADDIKVHYRGRGRAGRHQLVRAVDGISLDVAPSESVGLVGESGSGKSTFGRVLVGLRSATEGTITYRGEPVPGRSRRQRLEFRRRLQVVFQDPYSSLDPRMSIGSTVAEPLLVHRLRRGRAVEDYVVELLEQVGLSADTRRRYPHQLSGGQRQRVAIARALATEPEFLFCDEPVSALDVSVQAQILNLLMNLRSARQITSLFVSHDLAVVRRMADRVAVMYRGRLVEVGRTLDVYERAAHPYTVALLSSTPDPGRSAPPRERIVLTGDLPSPTAEMSGCPFHTRCWLYRQLGRPERCTAEVPRLRSVGATESACHFSEAVHDVVTLMGGSTA